MRDEILYMSGIVAAGFVVNFGLRALPFILFGGKDRTIPPWIDRVSGFISPVIIAALIVYSFTGLAWRTPWPYVAGVVAVALQLWKRNPLASIVAGTVVYMCLLTTGCASHPPIALDAQNPSVTITDHGVKIGRNLVKPQEVLWALEDNYIPKTRTVHILLDPDVRDMDFARKFMYYLRANGYTRAILVTKRHSESRVAEPSRKGKVRTPSGARPSVVVGPPPADRFVR